MAAPLLCARTNPEEHFRTYFCAAVHRLVEAVSESLGSLEEAYRQFPFLSDYSDAVEARGLDSEQWSEGVREAERATTAHLPLRAIRNAAGLDDEAITLLMAIGLNEEDARFGPLFEGLQNMGGQHHPTLGLLTALWRSNKDCAGVRTNLNRLRTLGLVQVINPETPRLEWALEVTAVVWDALRGERQEIVAPWAHLIPPEQLTARSDVILPVDTMTALAALPTLLDSGELQAVIVRGPQHNGRRTALGAIARELGRGVLEISGQAASLGEKQRCAGVLAMALNAMPVFVLDLSPGETAEIQKLEGYGGPLGVVIERHGGIGGSGVVRAITLSMDLPDRTARRRLWVDRLGEGMDEAIADRFRMSSGNIRVAAGIARAHASVAGSPTVTASHVRQATCSLNRQALETIAVNVPSTGGWERMAAADDTFAELRNLERRCRHRERLRETGGSALAGSLNRGVRALFSGPSGTGKTMAARLLAGELDMDLYRLDLAAVVNKYIGETEKNLSRAFARAEELDVILLLDEGDALLGSRTSVESSNDRYANLETNFLLERVESFDGILVVTTNAANRIDSAFQRRMDVVVEFRPPEPNERWMIWQLHLPPDHAVDPRWLEDAAMRCSLSGGQIRNAVLHASLAALSEGARISTAHTEEGVQREYRKAGAVCPLRRIR